MSRLLPPTTAYVECGACGHELPDVGPCRVCFNADPRLVRRALVCQGCGQTLTGPVCRTCFRKLPLPARAAHRTGSLLGGLRREVGGTVVEPLSYIGQIVCHFWDGGQIGRLERRLEDARAHLGRAMVADGIGPAGPRERVAQLDGVLATLATARFRGAALYQERHALLLALADGLAEPPGQSRAARDAFAQLQAVRAELDAARGRRARQGAALFALRDRSPRRVLTGLALYAAAVVLLLRWLG